MASVEEMILEQLLGKQGSVRGRNPAADPHLRREMGQKPEGTGGYPRGGDMTYGPDQDTINALVNKFGMSEEVAGNQPPSKVQGARRGPSLHSTNADERAKMRQIIETMEPDEYGDVDVLEMGPVSVDEAPTDGMISDHMWKIIQEVDPKDGEKFYQMPGKDALQTLGMDTKSNADLAAFWDRLSEEDRYYVIRALDSGIGGGMMSNRDTADTAMRMMDEDGEADDTEKALIDTIMKQQDRR